ncbi:thymic stromal lymphopoietin [Dipodomys merriami]|uniref:thymic stromal lymphopoietin n=1 Tax=Dipodomys merriami TaxID=94247 RepID=UPI003855EBBF
MDLQLNSTRPSKQNSHQYSSNSSMKLTVKESARLWCLAPSSWTLYVAVCFRELLLLQLVGVVVTYNFTNCNFKKIVKEYEHVISKTLVKYINGRTFNQDQSCYNSAHCLMKIENHTFNAIGECQTQFKKFAEETNASFTSSCVNYSRTQINNTQEMGNEEATSNCQCKASQILGWWRRFSQIAGD